MKSNIQQKLIIGSLGLVLVWIFTSCAQVRDLRERVLPSKKPKAEEAKKPGYYEHRVKWSGETLSIISKWYTGSFENWKTLAKTNPKINPRRIYLGQKIHIPENLLKTQEPMPESFVASFGPKKEKEPPPAPIKPEPARPKETKIAPRKDIKAEPPEKPAYYEHTVKWTGESLSIIAKWYTGSLDNWKALAKANSKINPSRIYIGQKLRIPEELLKTREPMPKSFLASPGSKKKGESAPPKSESPPPSDEEEPKLFGPKPYPKK